MSALACQLPKAAVLLSASSGRNEPMAAGPVGSAIRQTDVYESIQLSSATGLRDLSCSVVWWAPVSDVLR